MHGGGFGCLHPAHVATLTRVENFEPDAGFLTASKASAVPLKKRRTRTYRPVAHEAFGDVAVATRARVRRQEDGVGEHFARFRRPR